MTERECADPEASGRASAPSQPDQELLPGNVGGAVRIGGAVHRPVGPWTPAVHALLRHLQPRVPGVPEVHGFDEQGREVLQFLPGQVVDDVPADLTDRRLVALVAWTKQLHAAVDDFVHPGPWRYFPIPGSTLVGHNDIAHYNVCFDGDRLAGVFDWDLAGPTTPLDELAFMAWNCVPLWDDVGDATTCERLTLMADAYSAVSPADVLRRVPSRVQLMLDGIPRAAAAGDPGMQNLLDLGEPGRSQVLLDQLVTRLPRILDQLA